METWLDDFRGDVTSSTLRAANETHRLCSRTREALIEAEKRLAEMKGEMKTLESEFVGRNRELMTELEVAKTKALEWKGQNAKLKQQILRLVELDEAKNRQMGHMEQKLTTLEVELQKHVATSDASRSPYLPSNDRWEKGVVLGGGEDGRVGHELHGAQFTDQDGTRPVDAVDLSAANVRAECQHLVGSLKGWRDEIKGAQTSDNGSFHGTAAASVQPLLAALDQTQGSVALLLEPGQQATALQQFLTDAEHVLSAARLLCNASLRELQSNTEHQADETEYLKNEIRELRICSPSARALAQLHHVEHSIAQLEAKLDVGLSQCRKDLHRLERFAVKKAKGLLHRLDDVTGSVQHLQRGMEKWSAMTGLYDHLARLYDQNLNIIRELQTSGKQQHVRDLRVRLEKGVHHQAQFTNYIASIARREKGEAEGVGTPPPPGLTPPRESEGNEEMTEKYQKLWQRYRKQSLRFRAVQKLLSHPRKHTNRPSAPSHLSEASN